jgi:hypothetical protein
MLQMEPAITMSNGLPGQRVTMLHERGGNADSMARDDTDEDGGERLVPAAIQIACSIGVTRVHHTG